MESITDMLLDTVIEQVYTINVHSAFLYPLFHLGFFCVQYMYLDLYTVTNDRHVNLHLHKYVHLVCLEIKCPYAGLSPSSRIFFEAV